MHIIIDAETIFQSNVNIVFLDVRTKSVEFSSGIEAYTYGHIPGAVHLDMKADLSGKTTFLPDIATISHTLGSLGISAKTTVVIYDDGKQRAASKAWYVFYYLGHENIHILQGGFPAWVKAGGPITKEFPHYSPAVYTAQPRQKAVTNIQQVKEKLKTDLASLVDARAPERYEGIKEPKYHKAGHIPGAVNVHAKNVFTSEGHWKNKEELEKTFIRLNPKQEVIVSCGSGNSACMNLVALKEAGYDDVSLYAGGFGEWISDDANDVAKGKEIFEDEK